VILALLACATPSPPPAASPIRHAAGWDGLVAAADRGDLITAKALAQDLELGDVPDDDPAVGKLGAALGFVQVAEDREDLVDGVAKAREACADCHARNGIAAPR
jgi:hypothetical protein